MRCALAAVVLVCAVRGARADSCVDDAKPYDTKVLAARLGALAAKELDGRAPGTDGDRAARALIAERFECLGLVPAGDDGGFEHAFVAGTRTTANVVGLIKGKSDDIIVISAHHDHLGDGHLGANDNASGVTALLAIAQWIAQKGTTPARTLAFVTFGDEEDGMVGSAYFVKHAPAGVPLDKIVQVINLDMVGSYDSKHYVAAMGTFPKLPARTLLAKLDEAYKIKVGLGGRARGSDFEPFCDAGIPYVFFWTPDARCYHGTCDTADRIDYPHMAQIAALAGDLTWALSETTTDLAASRTKLGCFAREPPRTKSRR
jgi:hypothetical protein